MFKKIVFAIMLGMATFFNLAAQEAKIEPVSEVFHKVALININTADAKTIAEGLDGIGLKKAEAIVEYRQNHGPFDNKQALTQIKGIGDKLLTKNLERISL